MLLQILKSPSESLWLNFMEGASGVSENVVLILDLELLQMALQCLE